MHNVLAEQSRSGYANATLAIAEMQWTRRETERLMDEAKRLMDEAKTIIISPSQSESSTVPTSSGLPGSEPESPSGTSGPQAEHEVSSEGLLELPASPVPLEGEGSNPPEVVVNAPAGSSGEGSPSPTGAGEDANLPLRGEKEKLQKLQKQVVLTEQKLKDLKAAQPGEVHKAAEEANKKAKERWKKEIDDGHTPVEEVLKRYAEQLANLDDEVGRTMIFFCRIFRKRYRRDRVRDRIGEQQGGAEQPFLRLFCSFSLVSVPSVCPSCTVFSTLWEFVTHLNSEDSCPLSMMSRSTTSDSKCLTND